MNCIKCNSKCLPSKAYNNTLVSSNDFGNDANNRGITQSRIGRAVLVDCMKCTNCGHSFVPSFWESIPALPTTSDKESGICTDDYLI